MVFGNTSPLCKFHYNQHVGWLTGINHVYLTREIWQFYFTGVYFEVVYFILFR